MQQLILLPGFMKLVHITLTIYKSLNTNNCGDME